MHEPSTIFTEQELDNIRKMAVQMGADFCEFDVLRDNASGLIYVIDVNKTPYGPPAGLSASESMHAVSLLTNAFRKAFER
jgi:glutathione synthase/RimK-type ligase-like ATP-grasp enzyme